MIDFARPVTGLFRVSPAFRLTPNERRVLYLLDREPRLTMREIEQRLDLSPWDAKKALLSMLGDALVCRERFGGKTRAQWMLAPVSPQPDETPTQDQIYAHAAKLRALRGTEARVRYPFTSNTKVGTQISPTTRGRITDYLMANARTPVAAMDVSRALDIGQNSVWSALRTLTRTGEIVKLGNGRGTRYQLATHAAKRGVTE